MMEINTKQLENLNMFSKINATKIYNEMFNKSKCSRKGSSADSNCLILDFRKSSDFNNSHLKDFSINLPYDEISASDFSDFEVNFIEKFTKDKELITKAKNLKRVYLALLVSQEKIKNFENPSKLDEEEMQILVKVASFCGFLQKNKIREVGIYLKGLDHILQEYPFLATSKEYNFDDVTYRDFPSSFFKNKIFVGNENHATDESVIKGLKITHILNVTRHVPNKFEPDLEYLQLDINDKEEFAVAPFFKQAFDFLSSALESRKEGDENEGYFKRNGLTKTNGSSSILAICKEIEEADEDSLVEKIFNTAFKKLYGNFNSKTRILIHCSLGVSRSSTFLIMFIMKTFFIPYNLAFDFVKSIRTVSSPNIGFETELENFENREYTF